MSTTIVNSWQTLMEANADETVTDIKFADGGGIIDFNNVQATGFNTLITFNKPIDFNGWEFRNVYFRQSGSFKFTGTIQNANFLNVYSVCNTTDTSYGTFIFASYDNNNITISGLFVQGKRSILKCSPGTSSFRIQNSSFKLDVIGEVELMTSFSGSNTYLIDNCRFDINIVWRSTNQPYFHTDYALCTNCLFSGSIYAPNITATTENGNGILDRAAATNNIIDIRRRGSNENELRIKLNSIATTGLNIYSQDAGISWVPTNTTVAQGVNIAQLSQPDYLFDLGFPIAVGAVGT